MSLPDDFKKLPAEIAMGHSVHGAIQWGLTVTLPLPREDADRLYRLMDTRFQQWTGRSLSGYEPKRKDAP